MLLELTGCQHWRSVEYFLYGWVSSTISYKSFIICLSGRQRAEPAYVQMRKLKPRKVEGVNQFNQFLRPSVSELQSPYMIWQKLEVMGKIHLFFPSYANPGSTPALRPSELWQLVFLSTQWDSDSPWKQISGHVCEGLSKSDKLR